jgi:hypothetical protein
MVYFECILNSAQLSTFFLKTVAYNIDLNANYATQRIYHKHSIVSEVSRNSGNMVSMSGID